jgi:hypothetical protein
MISPVVAEIVFIHVVEAFRAVVATESIHTSSIHDRRVKISRYEKVQGSIVSADHAVQRQFEKAM